MCFFFFICLVTLFSGDRNYILCAFSFKSFICPSLVLDHYGSIWSGGVNSSYGYNSNNLSTVSTLYPSGQSNIHNRPLKLFLCSNSEEVSLSYYRLWLINMIIVHLLLILFSYNQRASFLWSKAFCVDLHMLIETFHWGFCGLNELNILFVG